MAVCRTAKLLATAVAVLSLSACSYNCGTASSTVASGTIRDAANATIATVQAHLSENVRPTFLRLGVGVMGSAGSLGAPLRGHVTRARLVSETGELLAEMPTGTATLYVDAVVALNVDLPSHGEYARVRNALLTNGARVILDTDVAGLEHIETILSNAHDEPANIQRCTPT